MKDIMFEVCGHSDAFNGTADLNWLAFQYVTGELSASDCEAFEVRLADDTSACEAVARATRLSAAVWLAVTSDADKSSDQLPLVRAVETSTSPKTGRLVATVVAASALAVAATGSFHHFKRSEPQPSVSSVEQRQAVELLRDWAQAGQNSAVVVADLRDSLPGDMADELAETQVPDWLLIAVEAEMPGIHNDDVMEN